MGDIQDKMLGMMQGITRDAGLDPVIQPGAANTGTLFVQAGLDTVLAVEFRFQARYCSLFYTGPAVEAWQQAAWKSGPGAIWQPQQKTIAAAMVEYASRTDLGEQFGMFTAMLACAAPAPLPSGDPGRSVPAGSDREVIRGYLAGLTARLNKRFGRSWNPAGDVVSYLIGEVERHGIDPDTGLRK